FEGRTIQAVSASASRDDEGRIHITFSNLDPMEGRTIEVDLRGADVSQVSGRILTADDMTAHNTFENPDVVTPTSFSGARMEGERLVVELPAKSVVALELRAEG